MFGTYQSSELRVEIASNASQLEAALTQAASLKKWLWPQSLTLDEGSSTLLLGQTFESSIGPVKTIHTVELISADGIRFLLNDSIDGFHEWQWGEGWIQSRIEGVSLLPLNLAQSASLLRLRQYLSMNSEDQ